MQIGTEMGSQGQGIQWQGATSVSCMAEVQSWSRARLPKDTEVPVAKRRLPAPAPSSKPGPSSFTSPGCRGRLTGLWLLPGWGRLLYPPPQCHPLPTDGWGRILCTSRCVAPGLAWGAGEVGGRAQVGKEAHSPWSTGGHAAPHLRTCASCFSGWLRGHNDSVGGRRKAVRDRFALQGGTGVFP